MTDRPGPGSGSAKDGLRDAALGAGVALVITLVLAALLLAVGMGAASVLVGAVAALFVTRPIAAAIGATLDERRRGG